MSKEIQFEIDKKQGFPVKIGEVELWFDDSFENISNFFDTEKKIKEHEKEIAEQLKKYEEIDEKTIDSKVAKEMLELKKKYIASYYDAVFGEGSFDKVYKAHPYIEQLEQLIIPISLSINEAIDDRQKEKAEKIKKEFLDKKAKKRR